MFISLIIIVLAIVIIAWIFSVYNSIIKLRNTTDESLGQIATQLQRRFDLIPNLVETVKGYASHEENTFKEITEARNASENALKSKNIDDITKADEAFGKAMLSVNAVAEAYPDLKASQNFSQLQEELTTTENKVSFSRQAFNSSVLDYNNRIQTVPGNIIAGIFHFQPKDMFQLEDEEAKKAPKVSFN